MKKSIEKKKSLNTEIVDVPGGMGCDFSVDLENVYYPACHSMVSEKSDGNNKEDINDEKGIIY